MRGTLMVQGTTSDAGKSTLVAGLARVLKRRGVAVVPFKPQNMALNSAVTSDGGEIGRAQALQAQAAGLAPHTDMNPVLLKPNSDTGAQIIIHGKVRADMDARNYHEYKPRALAAVLESYERLKQRYDVVLVEGAGSPAEINLRDRDIANMGFAEAVDCPVVLVADIDRGGVFAHLTGTLDCLSATEQARTRGFIINRFRGDKTLLDPGLVWLETKTAKPVFGVLPYLHGLQLDAEDGIQTEQGAAVDTSVMISAGKSVGNSVGKAARRLKVIVPVTPRISNHTDFDVLRAHPQVDLVFIGPGQTAPPADLIILAGTKATTTDLAWLRAAGWEAVLQRHLRYGGKVIGICGGMQMLGRALHDPHGTEGPAGSMPGLGLLDYDTTFARDKQLRQVSGTLCLDGAPAVTGYEIHMGITSGAALERPSSLLDGGAADDSAATAGHGAAAQRTGAEGGRRADGAISPDGQVLATYLHGVFDHPAACQALLHWVGLSDAQALDLNALREASLERLADTLEQHLDLPRLLAQIRP